MSRTKGYSGPWSFLAIRLRRINLLFANRLRSFLPYDFKYTGFISEGRQLGPLIPVIVPWVLIHQIDTRVCFYFKLMERENYGKFRDSRLYSGIVLIRYLYTRLLRVSILAARVLSFVLTSLLNIQRESPS